MSDTERLAEIQAREEAATPGPWLRAEPRGFHPPGTPVDHGWDHHPCNDIQAASKEDVVSSWGHDADGVTATDDDIDFIAHARADIPYLLAKVASQAEALKAVEALAEEMRGPRAKNAESSGAYRERNNCADAIVAALASADHRDGEK